MCRYHYEGTSLDQTQGYTLMSPHDQTDRPICYATTDYSAVWQLRSWLPDNVGGVPWVAPSRPCSSAYVPFYDSVTSVPAAWTDNTAYHAFRTVADNLDQPGTASSDTRYRATSGLCRARTARSRATARAPRRPRKRPPSGFTGAAQSTYLTTYSSSAPPKRTTWPGPPLPVQMP